VGELKIAWSPIEFSSDTSADYSRLSARSDRSDRRSISRASGYLPRIAMDMRPLRCRPAAPPPFHHDWRVVEDIDQERQPAFTFGIAADDPTQRKFRQYQLRCARCGKETWMRHTDAPMWVRYMR
jgi:hypothetical protein